MKAVDIWGACPYREITKTGRPRGWRYICRKTYGTCDPKYCLGPDEEAYLEEKETENED